MISSTIRTVVRQYARASAYRLNHLLPKRRRIVVVTGPDFEDQGAALLEQLAKHPSPPLVWLTSTNTTQPPARFAPLLSRLGARVIKRRSLRGSFYYFTSRWIFQTHGPFGSVPPPRSQVVVNLWHGMPIKAIELLEDPDGRPQCATWAVATSPFYQSVLGAAFGIDKAQVLPIGLPRNDLLSRQELSTPWRQSGIDLNDVDFIVMWLPTYRESALGAHRVDGVEYGNVFQFPDLAMAQLDAWLEKHNAMCIVKPHPMSPIAASSIASMSRVLSINDGWLRERGLVLYDLLAHADALITDLSSVWIDYLVLDRPIIIAFPDLNEYRQSRKLILEPYEDWVPGPIARSRDELFAAMSDAFAGLDEFAAQRREIGRKLNVVTDNRSTKRLLDHLDLGEGP